ncbi:MAG: hypothetical protein HOD72_08850 [Opitutae bacterium]|jgi:hypothetical protein|nr:hypothetical protein [Opitutae bacterium]MBT4224555.1 hypothetical protein [Opitutae bacterium]MBT5381110.1 hypothetical protein [Opitutae bacterium]MBT5691151.1 hypothetical protein [Opitutae bacterium]MBT6463753.1 hypothetical protein [Opitutae bacterium]
MKTRFATPGQHSIDCRFIRDPEALDQECDVSMVFGQAPIIYLPQTWTLVLKECPVGIGKSIDDTPALTPLLLQPGSEIRLIGFGSAQDYAKLEVREAVEKNIEPN